MKSSVEPMIHRFKQNGMNIVMDVNSAILHVVDDMTYDVLADYNGTNREAVHNRLDGTYKASELDEDMDEIDELIKQKILFAPMVDNYQLNVRLSRHFVSISLTTAIFAVNTALQDRAVMASGACL